MGVASPEADAGVADRARSAIQIVGLVIAPTTLVTALMFYFGWVQTNARSSYFGIDASQARSRAPNSAGSVAEPGRQSLASSETQLRNLRARALS